MRAYFLRRRFEAALTAYNAYQAAPFGMWRLSIANALRDRLNAAEARYVAALRP